MLILKQSKALVCNLPEALLATRIVYIAIPLIITNIFFLIFTAFVTNYCLSPSKIGEWNAVEDNHKVYGMDSIRDSNVMNVLVLIFKGKWDRIQIWYIRLSPKDYWFANISINTPILLLPCAVAMQSYIYIDKYIKRHLVWEKNDFIT